MYKIAKQFASMFSFLLLAIMLQGCSDKEQERANALVQSTTITYDETREKYKELEKYVDGTKRGLYENTLLVAIDKVKRENPDSPAIQDMVNQFQVDMTKKGTIFKGVQSDYQEVMNHAAIPLLSQTTMPKEKLNSMLNLEDELVRLRTVINPVEYDKRYIDYINTLAAISPSITPVIVDTVDKNASFGSQFVGNEQYGQWKTNSSGHTHWSFFEVYGFMSFIDDAFFDNNRRYSNCSYYNYRYDSCNSRGYNRGYSNNRYRYDNWRNTRNYSYYNDVYASKYEKPSVRNKYQSNLTKHSKVYSKSIKPKNTVSKQNTKIAKTNKKYSSNLLSSSKLKGASGNKNTGYTSGNKNGSIKNNNTTSVNNASGGK